MTSTTGVAMQSSRELLHNFASISVANVVQMYIFEDELERFPSVVAQLSAPLEAVAPEPLTALAS
eukprot:2966388-Pleurochrysis_carterae.AAC.1